MNKNNKILSCYVSVGIGAMAILPISLLVWQNLPLIVLGIMALGLCSLLLAYLHPKFEEKQFVKSAKVVKSYGAKNIATPISARYGKSSANQPEFLVVSKENIANSPHKKLPVPANGDENLYYMDASATSKARVMIEEDEQIPIKSTKKLPSNSSDLLKIEEILQRLESEYGHGIGKSA